MTPPTPESLFAARLSDDPSRPLVTFYDQATSERAELSAKSIANWVAKTYSLVVDELALGVGGRAYLSLPVHWLGVPVLFGCWFAGLEVTTSPADAVVAFGDGPSLESADLVSVDDVFAVSLLSMGRSAEPPTGMIDYAGAVRPQPDNWAGVKSLANAAAPALNGQSRADAVVTAQRLAAEMRLGDGGRLLFSADRFGPEDWVRALLAPLAVAGSVVLLRNADASKVESLISAEHVTATWGT
jgi:uncharacterized protein (TIGR03089 family)